MRALAALSLLALLAATAHAQGGPAEALIKEGLEHRRQRRDAEALAAFQRAQELSPSPRTVAQIGMAEQALGRWLDAEKHLLEALGQKRDPWVARRREVLESALAQVRGNLGWLKVHTNLREVTLWIDGRKVAVLPLASPLRTLAGGIL